MPQCSCCGQEIPLGQSVLTDREIRKLPMGNQNTKWNVVKWQVVKAAAEFYGVSDWTSKVDRSLTYEENVALMERYGTNVGMGGGPSVRELAAEEMAKMRWE